MLLIITGHPRSGTTLLYRLCDSHPDIRLTKEFGCLRALGVPIGLYALGILGRFWATFNNPILIPPGVSRRSQLLRSYLFEVRFLRRLYRSHASLVTVSDVESALRHLLPGARIVGDKFTDYVFALNQFVELDGVSTVVIYRDCRDVTASYLERVRTDWRGKQVLSSFDTPGKIASRWLSAITWMNRHQNKVCTIRYEDLVQQPEHEIEKLSQCLNVDPTGFSKELIYGTSVGSYRHRLSAEELSAVMEVAGQRMTELGYD
jgi:hypothetical protein